MFFWLAGTRHGAGRGQIRDLINKVLDVVHVLVVLDDGGLVSAAVAVIWGGEKRHDAVLVAKLVALR